MWEQTNLEPGLSVPDFVLQLWRFGEKSPKLQDKIRNSGIRMESLRLGLRLGINYSTVHVASFPNFHVPRFHPMQYGMWSQLATGAGKNKVAIYGYSTPST